MGKGKLGGRYERVGSGRTRRPNEDEAGVSRRSNPDIAGRKRKFFGSASNQYTFSDTIHGTHTFTAETYEDALRIAESMGYTRADYKKR